MHPCYRALRDLNGLRTPQPGSPTPRVRGVASQEGRMPSLSPRPRVALPVLSLSPRPVAGSPAKFSLRNTPRGGHVVHSQASSGGCRYTSPTVALPVRREITPRECATQNSAATPVQPRMQSLPSGPAVARVPRMARQARAMTPSSKSTPHIPFGRSCSMPADPPSGQGFIGVLGRPPSGHGRSHARTNSGHSNTSAVSSQKKCPIERTTTLTEPLYEACADLVGRPRRGQWGSRSAEKHKGSPPQPTAAAKDDKPTKEMHLRRERPKDKRWCRDEREAARPTTVPPLIPSYKEPQTEGATPMLRLPSIPVCSVLPPCEAVLLPLPICTDSELRRLFALLLPLRPRDSAWSLHRHLVPFLAAFQDDILPVSASDVRAFLGLSREGEMDKAAVTEHESHTEDGLFSAAPQRGVLWAGTVVEDFASELCFWFMYVGTLGCCEQAGWATLLGIDKTAPPKAALNTPTTFSLLSSGVSTGSSTPERNTGKDPTTPSVIECNMTGCVFPLCNNEDIECSPAESVLWYTERSERAAVERTASVTASIEFRAVVEAPPYVLETGFIRGYRVLQALWDAHAAQLAALQTSSAVTAFHAAFDVPEKSLERLWETDGSDAGALRQLPLEVRIVLRRVQFYARLHAFVRKLLERLQVHQLQRHPLDSMVMESIVRSRLHTTDGAAVHSASAGGKGGGRREERREAPVAHGGQEWTLPWWVEKLLQRCWEKIFPECHNSLASHLLEALVVVRHCAVQQLVRRCLEEERESVGTTPPRTPDENGDSGSAHTSPSSLGVPARLLLLLPLPRWVSTQQRGISQRSGVSLFSFLLYSLGVAAATVALLFSLLLLSWCTGQSRSAGFHGERASLPSAPSLLFTQTEWTLDVSMLPLFCLIPVVIVVVAHYAAAWIASQEMILLLTSTHITALVTASSGWLEAAWTLRKQDMVAAAAVHRCVARLRHARQVIGAPHRHSPSFGHVLRASVSPHSAMLWVNHLFLCLWIGLTRLMWIPWADFASFACSVLVVAEAALCFYRAWQQRRRALAWRVCGQAVMAENFALELLCRAGERGRRMLVKLDRHSNRNNTPRLVSPAPVPLHVADELHFISIPFVEDVVKVACLVTWCEWRAALSTGPSDATPLAAALRLPLLRLFWVQFCGHAVPSYADGVSCASIVERVKEECQRTLEDAGPRTLTVGRALAQFLPWVGQSVVTWLPSTDAMGGEALNCPLDAVLAPLVADVTKFEALERDHRPSVGGLPPRQPSMPSCPTLNASSHTAPETSMPLDLELRRRPRLPLHQQRLVVCAAFVFAALHISPPHMASSLTEAMEPPSVSSASGRPAERTVSLLVHLVAATMDANVRGGDNGSADTSASLRWFTAVRRCCNTLQLLQRFIESTVAQHDVYHLHRGEGGSCACVLSLLLHTLFRDVEQCL